MNETERNVLARRLRGEVADALTERRRADEADGRPWMDADDQRVFGRRLINAALERHATDRLDQGLAPLASDQEQTLGQSVHDALFGLGPLERLLADESVENINANGAEEVWVTYADGRKQLGPPIAESDAELVETIRATAARAGLSERRFDVGRPELNLELPDGSRLFAVMSVTARPSLSIRRHRFPKVTVDDLVGLGMLDRPMQAFLTSAVRARKNLLVCGGTGAGKTTLLRGLLNEVDPGERLVTIEDNFELGLQRHPDLHPDVVAMEAREANVEGEGEITMAQLVRMGLRMSPDRVIVGEVRGAEVLSLLNAMSQGNDGSMATIHADSSAGAFARLAMYAVQAPERLPLEATNLLVANSIDFVVFIAQDAPTVGVQRRRYISSVREVVGAEGQMVVSNEVFAPGPDRRAVPAVPLRQDTAADLARVGLAADALAGGSGWSR